jgi:hypothetical protein
MEVPGSVLGLPLAAVLGAYRRGTEYPCAIDGRQVRALKTGVVVKRIALLRRVLRGANGVHLPRFGGQFL